MRTGREIEMTVAPPPAPAGPSGGSDRVRHSVARLVLVAILLGLGAYLLSNYLRALVWAVVLAIALWPLYHRIRRRAPKRLGAEFVPAAFTVAVGLVFVLPFALLVIEAAREAHDIFEYGKQVQQSGMPAPDFLSHLPFGAQAAAHWWDSHLAQAGWIKETGQNINTSSNRDLGRTVGANAIHRVVLFGFCLLTLFFLFRDGESVIAQCLVASEKLLGPRGERVAQQMVASVHGTVNGLVLVGIGDGVLLGIVYFFAGVPHPVLFGAFTAVAAMIPFAAALAILLAALLLLTNGGVVGAVVVVAAGFAVTFAADHFVRPSLIGGATKLPFLWVLLGILGGVETFSLLGLFGGPAIMAALILLWREYTGGEAGGRTAHADAGTPVVSTA